jgi:hypothetical protein
VLPEQPAEYFSRYEIENVSDAIPAELEGNVLSSIRQLNTVRTAFGVPFALTSGYRTSTHNSEVGGSATSDHMNGLSWDFYPRGLSLSDFYTRWRALDDAGVLPAYDQMIVYPYTTGHVHVGFGSRLRRQLLIRVSDDAAAMLGSTYAPLVSIDQFPSGVAAVEAAVSQAVNVVKQVASDPKYSLYVVATGILVLALFALKLPSRRG